MIKRRVLFLDTAGLSAWHITGNAVEEEGAFVADEAGLAAFADYLRARAGSLFMLLVDLPEEGFHTEEIPASRGRDRAAIVKRKLGQHYYGTPFSLAVSQGRSRQGRRDERLLLMALTAPQMLEPWLGTLRSNRAILAGIYSVPQLMHHLLPASAPAQVLLISQGSAGLRQTYFADRQLRFSRLTPLVTGSAEEAAIAAVLEAGKMHQYLASQRLIERNRPLATRILAHPSRVAAMRERCRSNRELDFEFVDLLQEVKRHGLRSCHGNICAVPLLCHLLGRKTPAEQFAPPAERQYFRLWQTRFALVGASAVVLAAGLLFAARQGLESWRMESEIDEISQQTRLDRQRYDAALQTLPRVPLSTDDLRALVDRYDRVSKRAVGPAPLLIQLSRTLDAFPSIAIDQLEWEVIEQLPPAPASGASVALPPHMAGGPYAVATVVARLPLGLVGDHRGQLNLVADFAKHLNQAPDSLAIILSPPVDTQSGKTLKSSDTASTPEAPRFSFRLARKL